DRLDVRAFADHVDLNHHIELAVTEIDEPAIALEYPHILTDSVGGVPGESLSNEFQNGRCVPIAHRDDEHLMVAIVGATVHGATERAPFSLELLKSRCEE